MDMPTPKLLTPDEFPTICPVFHAASHGEALDLADYHFRQDGVEAAVWYRKPIGLDWDLIEEDRRLLLEACVRRNIKPNEKYHSSLFKKKLDIHYDYYYDYGFYDKKIPRTPNPNYFFMRAQTRALILRTPFNELGTIIFDTKEKQKKDCSLIGPYQDNFGTPWQAKSNSVMFIKNIAFKNQAALHTEPTYDLTMAGYSRHIDVIDLNCYRANPPSHPLPLPPTA